MHIVITRPKEDSLYLIENLIKLGHEVTHLPVIKIEKLETKKIDLLNYQAVIFTSSNGIRFMDIEKLDKNRVDLRYTIEKGDKAAMKELVEANLRFVVSVAKKYQGNGLSLSDIINEGNLGLIKAAKRFDPSRGFKFISYAVWWIRQSILQALAEQSRIVRLPLNKIGSINKINKIIC